MFQPDIYMTSEDNNIAINVMDWSSFYIDDSYECAIMRDCVRLSDRGFKPKQILIIMEKTENRPFNVV
jgi:hypothetical protein